MGLYKTLPTTIQEVDVIIAGGGTAGCIVAARLAEADPQLSILLIENGQDNYQVPQVIHPALFRSHLIPGSKTCLQYKSCELKQLAGRSLIAPSGGLLGGGSSMNGLLYTRAQRCDYDSWDIKGWSSNDLLPCLKKFETYHGPGSKDRHGVEGPLEISRGSYRGKPLEEDFVAAMKSVGFPEASDLQDLETANAVAHSWAYISPDGRRQDTAHNYLHPKLQDGKHPNLHVLVEAQVVRVLLDNEKRASGVEYRANPGYQTDTTKQQKQTINARKLVILSAGTIGTPSMLERSGIGNTDSLTKANVKPLHSLPGVGNNYQDHQLLLSFYKAAVPPSDTLDHIFTDPQNIPELLRTNSSKLSWNGFDASAKVRPTESDIDNLGPHFRKAWDKDFGNNHNKPLVSMLLYSGILGNPAGFPPEPHFTVGSYAAYPYSRGYVHITGPEIDDSLDYDPGYLADPGDFDLKTHVWAYKKHREVARRMPSYGGEVVSKHPQFPPGSKAALITLGDDSGAVKDIEYSPEDDQSIEQWIRENVGVCWHFLGTCKMAPPEEMGVVNEKLDVHGLRGLKIADMSIAPKMVSANTQSTALMIGEKAAEIIIKELGLAEK
ncbi:putative alcohol oxidase [Hypoxylon sp. CO27-5]|nr:putative alcohol oxidase [Hypoxylon sp. CO27-5]